MDDLVSQSIKRFQPDSSYAPNNTADFFTDEVMEKWNDLMPSKSSYILACLGVKNLTIEQRVWDSCG